MFKIVDDKFYGFFWAPEKNESMILNTLHASQSSIGIER